MPSTERLDTGVGELLRANEAAALLGVSPRFFWQAHATGRLGPRPIRLGARCVRWRRQTLLSWLDAGAPSREVWEEGETDGHEKS